MSDDLYHKAIMRLAADAHGAGRLEHPDASATLQNPVCGDRVTLDIMMEDGRISRIGHETRACLLCQAAASLLAELGPGHNRQDISALEKQLKDWLSGKAAPPAAPWERLAHFSPVLPYKSRHSCVWLPFEAAARALKSQEGSS